MRTAREDIQLIPEYQTKAHGGARGPEQHYKGPVRSTVGEYERHSNLTSGIAPFPVPVLFRAGVLCFCLIIVAKPEARRCSAGLLVPGLSVRARFNLRVTICALRPLTFAPFFPRAELRTALWGQDLVASWDEGFSDANYTSSSQKTLCTLTSLTWIATEQHTHDTAIRTRSRDSRHEVQVMGCLPIDAFDRSRAAVD